MKKMCPCKDCRDRHLACHDTCEKYKEWHSECEADQKYLDSFKRERLEGKWHRSNLKNMHISSKPKEERRDRS